MKDWSWWNAWRSGSADESKRALDAETDQSLAKDPGRWSWGKRVEETVDHPKAERGRRGGHTADRRHHSGKGRVDKGESGERTSWRDSEWRNARADYQRQNPRDERPYRGWPGEDERR